MLQQRWNEATSRERLFVIVMGVVLFCAVLTVALVRPAWHVVQSAPATLSALDAKTLIMRRQAAELLTVPATAPVSTTVSAFAERELASPGASVTEVRDNAAPGQTTITVNLKGVESTRFGAWIVKPEVQQQMLRLNLKRDPITGRVTGAVVLRASP